MIGRSRFIYDLWGYTVNAASRMESYGEPGRIQYTEEVQSSLSASFDFEPRVLIDIKGKGPMPTYFLTAARS